MSEGIRRAQRADGVWNPNLGDPEDNAGKEMTGTGGFVYGMALGVRLGILDAETYIPVLQRAYETIVNECIFENGRLLSAGRLAAGRVHGRRINARQHECVRRRPAAYGVVAVHASVCRL